MSKGEDVYGKKISENIRKSGFLFHSRVYAGTVTWTENGCGKTNGR